MRRAAVALLLLAGCSRAGSRPDRDGQSPYPSASAQATAVVPVSSAESPLGPAVPSAAPLASGASSAAPAASGGGAEVIAGCVDQVTAEGPRLSGWPAAYKVRGIDASSPESWASLRSSGLRFAFVQVAIGTRLNDSFAASWRTAKACGFPRAAYHFLGPRADGGAQAALFLAQLGDDRGELPPVVDVELPPGCKGPCCEVSAAGWMATVRSWIEAVRKVDRREPTVYAVEPFWKECLENSSRLADHRLWLAGYPRFDLAPRPGFGGWQRWDFYQFKGNARAGGGVVDLDVFRGSESDFAAFVAASAPPREAP